MAFIVPNAGQTGGSATYINVNQAEPDSLDFEILGNRSSWVRSGGNITVSSTQVSVASGVAVIQGVPYSFNSATLTIPNCTNGAVARFDAVVVRLSGGTATVTRILGLESDVNPTLPQSRSTLGALSYNAGYHIDFATDVVLYIVYKAGSTGLVTSNVVDKRVIDARPVTYSSTSAPVNGTPGVVGDRRIVSGVTYTYVRDTIVEPTDTNWVTDGTEEKIETLTMPVGAIMVWPGTASPPEEFLPCDGSTLSKSSYESLWDVIGYKYGGSGDTFYLPSMNDDRTVYGVPINSLYYGTAVGDNSFKLVEAHIPQHSHSLTTNGSDNTHAEHRHTVNTIENSTPGSGSYLMAGNGNVGTKTTRNTSGNTVGMGHQPVVGTYGRPSNTQTSITTKGRHINLSWYIRVK